MRTNLCLYYLLYYMAWVCFYLLVQQSPYVDITDKKLMFYYPNTLLLLFYILIGQNCETYLEQIKTICLLSIIACFVIIILNWHGILTDTYKLMYNFCGLVFATSVAVLYSGGRHGLLNE